jgi:hypothetical protein
MSRPYRYNNINWRTDEPTWLWSELYKGWLAEAEANRPSLHNRKYNAQSQKEQL